MNMQDWSQMEYLLVIQAVILTLVLTSLMLWFLGQSTEVSPKPKLQLLQANRQLVKLSSALVLFSIFWNLTLMLG